MEPITMRDINGVFEALRKSYHRAGLLPDKDGRDLYLSPGSKINGISWTLCVMRPLDSPGPHGEHRTPLLRQNSLGRTKRSVYDGLHHAMDCVDAYTAGRRAALADVATLEEGTA